MKPISRLALALVLASSPFSASAAEEAFKQIFDGKSFAGWKMANENTNTWKLEDGALVTRGGRCHLYYVGDEKPFKDFELKVDVMTEPGSNGGIYFHTKWQESDWPKAGFECQVNVTHTDWKKTGSLYDIANLGVTPAQDNKVTVKIDGKTVLEYNEPPGAQPGKPFMRKLDEGTFALQAHDPKSV